jgi:8-oxo-dGTP pyrophosphatase MutT (NUDIX family)
VEEIALIQIQLGNSQDYVFQRRDDMAPTSPNLLGYFGGSIEHGEKPRTAATRELSEETSLDVNNLTFKHLISIELPPNTHNQPGTVKAHLFTTSISDTKFKVYEGIGSEIYTKQEILDRKDVSPIVQFLVKTTF